MICATRNATSIRLGGFPQRRLVLSKRACETQTCRTGQCAWTASRREKDRLAATLSKSLFITTDKPQLDPLFSDEVDYLIRMIRMREIYAIELMLEPMGLGLSAWYPLAVLNVEDGMSQRELGLRLNRKDAAIGKAFDALEKVGLVERRNNARGEALDAANHHLTHIECPVRSTRSASP